MCVILYYTNYYKMDLVILVVITIYYKCRSGNKLLTHSRYKYNNSAKIYYLKKS